jgi:hypothetical protein
MVFQRIALAVALLLAFTLGISGYAFDGGFAPKTKTDTAASHMIMVDASMPVQGKCDPCGKGNPRTSACSIICSGTMLPLPVAVRHSVSVTGTLYDTWPDRQVTGSAISPDPYPPKSIILV